MGPDSEYRPWRREQKAPVPEDSELGFAELEPSFQRLERLNARLLMLYLDLERVELSAVDAPAQVWQVQQKMAEIIWTIEAWRAQLAQRN